MTKLKVRFEQVALVAAMSVVSVSIWTAAPLLGVWVGSRVVSDSGATMATMLVIVVTILVACLVLVKVLAYLGAAHDQLTGRDRGVRQHVPWLRSMRGERPHDTSGPSAQLSALERVLVLAVVACWIAFEIWFFFYSSSPIDQRSGRD